MNQKELRTLINRLVLVQMYRVEAYREALETSRQPDLEPFFHESIDSGEKLIEQLFAQINPLHISETEDTVLPANFQFVWNLLPDALHGHDKDYILNQCLMAEDQTLRIYRKLIGNTSEVPVSIRRLLTRQWIILCGAIACLRRLKSATVGLLAKPWRATFPIRFLLATGQRRAIAIR